MGQTKTNVLTSPITEAHTEDLYWGLIEVLDKPSKDALHIYMNQLDVANLAEAEKVERLLKWVQDARAPGSQSDKALQVARGNVKYILENLKKVLDEGDVGVGQYELTLDTLDDSIRRLESLATFLEK